MATPQSVIEVYCKILTRSDIATEASDMSWCVDEKQCLAETLFTAMHDKHPEIFPTANEWRGDWFEKNDVYLQFEVDDGNKVGRAKSIGVDKENGAYESFILERLCNIHHIANSLRDDYSPDYYGSPHGWSTQFSKILLFEKLINDDGTTSFHKQELFDTPTSQTSHQKYYLHHNEINTQDIIIRKTVNDAI